MVDCDPRSDAELLEATDTEPEAFGIFYRRHAPWVLRYLARRVDDRDVVGDLVAEVFATALISLPKFDAGAGIGELQLLRGSRAGAPLPPADDDPARPRDAPLEAPKPSATPLRRSSVLPEGEAALLCIEVSLPEELISCVRSQLRPTSTGHPRTLSVALLLQAYVRAVHALGLDVDVEGLSPAAGRGVGGRADVLPATRRAASPEAPSQRASSRATVYRCTPRATCATRRAPR